MKKLTRQLTEDHKARIASWYREAELIAREQDAPACIGQR
jgi:hypothetical protein